MRPSVPSAERKVPLICETFWGTELQIDRQATTKTNGQKREKQHGQTERQVVPVGVTSFEAKQHDRQASRRQTEQTGTCKHPCTPVELHIPGHTLLRVCLRVFTRLCLFVSCFCVSACVYMHYVSGEFPAALLDPVNNHPTGNSTLDSAHTLDLVRSERRMCI